MSGGPDDQRRGTDDPYAERALDLFVSARPEAHRRATIRAEGVARPPLELWVYENLEGEPCASTAAERGADARTIISGLPVSGPFSEKRRVKMRRPGQHSYCAYLGPNEAAADLTSFELRRVLRPLLRARRARRTVAAALRRHEFAPRVIENLERRCKRRSRSRFRCRFSSQFPGYSLSGRGFVVLRKRLSYRFKASARGESFVLTDENEGTFPG